MERLNSTVTIIISGLNLYFLDTFRPLIIEDLKMGVVDHSSGITPIIYALFNIQFLPTNL